MIDVQNNLTNTDQYVDSFHVLGDSCYKAERGTYSEAYTEHLYEALLGEVIAVDECDFEDGYRYEMGQDVSDMPRTTARPVREDHPVKTPVNTVRTETVREFNRKRIPWLIAYGVVIFVAILVLALMLPGTAWETRVNRDILTTEPAMAESAEVINTICLPDGTKQVVTLEPYAEQETETNWFDKMCDWISGVIGG